MPSRLRGRPLTPIRWASLTIARGSNGVTSRGHPRLFLADHCSRFDEICALSYRSADGQTTRSRFIAEHDSIAWLKLRSWHVEDVEMSSGAGNRRTGSSDPRPGYHTLRDGVAKPRSDSAAGVTGQS